MKDKIQKIISETIGVYHGANTQFAKKIGARPGLVGDWLSGRSSPKDYYRDKICKELNISREWLDSGTGEMLVKKQVVVEATTISEREIGKLEGKIEILTAQIRSYERRLDKYDNEIHECLKKCTEIISNDQKVTSALKSEHQHEGQYRRATAIPETEVHLVPSGRHHR